MTSAVRPGEPPAPLPFFVYGTLRPGEVNHDLFLRGRTAREEPARLPDAALYDGPGYPYAVHRPGSAVLGELITPAPGAYPELLAALDRLEEYEGPGRPGNLYDRIAREVLRPDGTAARAWVYLAAPLLARDLRASGTEIPGGDWLGRRGA
ncbi:MULTISPECIES: gamma-glutamylcyclotransferase family protein [Streptomyces]|uniref:gamma-glutamylcyclotransferase family protein n=1 Tax=Streptomyces TaxID=1883 RepID=UPI00226EB0EC|nr:MULTISPECIES: gamma-glutamylcyclotransferase family protein [unclassified Streptomyces]MCY0944448.1 gamma-glutamylcyclotransferase [Streptomyces sp. H34-AA3]MCY0948750.1 gamma-glutamylcyclotransferase [Streptomyces sp. H27-S2]MCZ4082876.1 gamma-glutamylcyclotransferase [Streptomyces sp. H34-S5]